jgi:hypothetical protein
MSNSQSSTTNEPGRPIQKEMQAYHPKSVWETLQYERRDLWIGPNGEIGRANEFFNTLYSNEKETPWKEWQKYNLRRLQDVLLDRLMDKEKLELLAIRPHDKHAVEESWPALSRRDAELVFAMGGNVAVKCGPKFNLIIVDLDPTDDLPTYWKKLGTLTTRTGHGYHQYFRHRKDIDAETSDRIYEGMCQSLGHVRKIRCCGSVLRYGGGYGAYALIPLSIHPSAKLYRFVDYQAPIQPFSKVLTSLGEMQSRL